MAFGKDLTLQTHGLDKYERPLANAVFPDDINVNHTLVKDGWCWWYRKYGAGRVKAKGLWADPLPVPPWEW